MNMNEPADISAEIRALLESESPPAHEFHRGRVVVFSFRRPLEGRQALWLRWRVGERVGLGERHFLMDLRQVQRVSGFGVEVALHAAALARSHGGDLRLVASQWAIWRSLGEIGSHPALRVFPSLEAGVVSFGRDGAGRRERDDGVH